MFVSFMWSRVRIAVPRPVVPILVCATEPQESSKTGLVTFVKNSVYFLFMQEVFQHCYPGLRIYAINV
jgi:hypothetical protein